MIWIGLAFASVVAIVAFELVGPARATLTQAEGGLANEDRTDAPVDLGVPMLLAGILLGLAIGLRRAFAYPMYVFFAGYGCLFLYSVGRILYFRMCIRRIDNENDRGSSRRD